MAKAGELNAQKSLTALGDDPLRHALGFLSVAECRRSVGATSKHFRAMATSTALARTRFSDQLADWRVLYDSGGVSPWPIGPGGWGVHTLFQVGPSFPSSRFRIRLTSFDITRDESCMHVRGFEVFGAILPPWRIDV